MTITHHPDDQLLQAYASGALDFGEHAAVTTHLQSCPRCRGWIGTLEALGGTALSDLPPTPVRTDALEQTLHRLAHAEQTPTTMTGTSANTTLATIPGLPPVVQRLTASAWKWIAPGVWARPFQLPTASPTRLFLLKSRPGLRMLAHRHSEVELTCVLAGGFSHDGGEFWPGDFDLGDRSHVHHITVADDGECLCLVAMRGRLRFDGLVGPIIDPLIRL